jgi:hypothetical protein
MIVIRLRFETTKEDKYVSFIKCFDDTLNNKCNSRKPITLYYWPSILMIFVMTKIGLHPFNSLS